MSTPVFLASLCGLVLAAACRHHPPPEPTARLDRDSTCAPADSGVDVGQDVRRGPRYRVDSSGRVDTLPPLPVTATDSTRRACPAAADTSQRGTAERSKP
jgi:hypothetical protein